MWKTIPLFAICIATMFRVGGLPAQPAGNGLATEANLVRFEAFVRGDLPAADEVRAYTDDLKARVPGLEIMVYDVLEDRDQLIRLHALTKEFGRSKAVVPAFYCCNRMYFGFADAESSGPRIENLFTADVYTRNTCPRCQSAKAFIRQLQPQWPAIRFRIHEVTYDATARSKWEELCRSAGQLPGLPTIDFGGSVLIGYQGDSTSGKQLEQLIEKVSGPQETQKPGPQPSDGSQLDRQGRKMRFQLLIPPLLSSIAMLHVLPQDDGFDDLALPGEADSSDLGEGVSEKPPDLMVESDQSISVPVFGTLRVSDLGLPTFTFAVGLIDGFNPCAMWVLVFLLSVLVNVKDRRKIIAIAGTFVLVSGLAYFAFMAAWLNLFMLIGIARPVQILLGAFAIFIGVINVKDFFAFKKGLSLSIPESSKPGLYRRVREIVNAKYLTVAIASAITLAIVVNLIELLCTAGLPALYTQILTLQNLPVWENYAYLGLYITAYMFDDTLLLVAVVATLSHRKLQEREGQWLKLISGLVILLLGLVMIFRPAWLQLGQ